MADDSSSWKSGHGVRMTVEAVNCAPVRARLAAVATGRTAAAPPIPHIGMRGYSDPPTPDSAGEGGRASLVLPVRTSARLPRKVALVAASTAVY